MPQLTDIESRPIENENRAVDENGALRERSTSTQKPSIFYSRLRAGSMQRQRASQFLETGNISYVN